MGRGAAIAAILALALGGGAARAQSAYGCADLALPGDLPVVEGRGGMFYRVRPDLENFFDLSDETVERLGELSDTLLASGTRLIYVPVPTKSLAVPALLNPEAEDFGFDRDLATTVFDDILRRLERRGIFAADLRKPMVSAQSGALTHFQSDHRWTPDGARIAAAAVATRMGLVSGSGAAGAPMGPVTLPSRMFAQIQQHCQGAIPPVRALGYGPGQPGTAPLFGGGPAAPVVVVGTEYSAETASNFAGFLARATGQGVAFYGVPEGGAFAAITSYLTSDLFAAAPPAFLVWEVPVEANLARHGDQPMRELIALAGTACRLPAGVFATEAPERISVDLSGLDPATPQTLLVDGDTASTRATFTFRSRSGLTRTRTVLRHPEQRLNGRFAMPLSGLWPEGAASVEVEFTAPAGANRRALACVYGGQG